MPSPMLEAVLREFELVDIVISSTWRLQHSLAQLQALFSADIDGKIIDVTPIWQTFDPLPRLALYPRHAEIEEWLKQSGRVGEAWVALDDRGDSLLSIIFDKSCTNLPLYAATTSNRVPEPTNYQATLLRERLIPH